MRITLQIVECHTKQPIPCIVLSIESQKYFFNIPESFQRFFREHSVKFSRGSKIFLTQLSADHTTGLFGLILTLNEQGLANNAQLFGPPGLSQYLDSIRFLIGHRLIPYSIYDFFNNHAKLLGIKSEKFEEEVMQGKEYGKIFFKMNDFLLKEQKANKDLINDAQDFIKEEFYKDENLEIHPVLLTGDTNDKQAKPTLCYILKPDKIPGKVNAEKLKAHNIPAKNIGKLLQDGQIEVNGVIHKAEEFKDPDDPSPIVVLIDCPSQAHFASLLNQEKIKNLYAERINAKDDDLKAVVHMVSSSVLLDPQYGEFLKNFPESCQHIFLNDDIKPLEVEIKTSKGKDQDKKKGKATESLADPKQFMYKHFMITNVLSKYFPDHFPVLEFLKPNAKYSLEELFPFLPKKITYPKLLELVLAPVKNEGFSPVNFTLATKFLNYTEPEEFKKYYKKWLALAQEPIKSAPEIQEMFKSCDPELLFLGTQSMRPSQYCNVSGIYLKFWQQDNIGVLLDCGEGSYSQLLHHYGPEKTRELVKNLNIIYITHMHADHLFGLLQLIKERDRILQEEKFEKDPLFLVLPFNCAAWTAKFSQMIDRLNYKVVFNEHIKIESSPIHADTDIHQSTGTVVNQMHEETKTDEYGNKHTVHVEEEEFEFKFYEASGMADYLLEEENVSKANARLLEEFLLKKLGIVKLKSVDVEHCPQSYGVYIEHKDGWRFVYSGDTRPCETMVKEVGTSTILVHEATFGEDLQHQAIEKMHSTDREATEIGMKLKAWRTILTHFSQRYNSMTKPQVSKKVKDEYYYYSKRNVVKACDHFRTKFSQLENMPVLSRCIANMFDEFNSCVLYENAWSDSKSLE